MVVAAQQNGAGHKNGTGHKHRCAPENYYTQWVAYLNTPRGVFDVQLGAQTLWVGAQILIRHGAQILIGWGTFGAQNTAI